VVWWEDRKINALEIARGLWEQTHPKIASDKRTSESAASANSHGDAATANHNAQMPQR